MRTYFNRHDVHAGGTFLFEILVHATTIPATTKSPWYNELAVFREHWRIV
jgi:hypothetical protein